MAISAQRLLNRCCPSTRSYERFLRPTETNQPLKLAHDSEQKQFSNNAGCPVADSQNVPIAGPRGACGRFTVTHDIKSNQEEEML